jgi:hypothetical protein
MEDLRRKDQREAKWVQDAPYILSPSIRLNDTITILERIQEMSRQPANVMSVWESIQELKFVQRQYIVPIEPQDQDRVWPHLFQVAPDRDHLSLNNTYFMNGRTFYLVVNRSVPRPLSTRLMPIHDKIEEASFPFNPMFKLICSGFRVLDILKFFTRTGDLCTTFGSKIAKSLIKIASQRIFAEPEQSIMELPVNSLDSYQSSQGGQVGKFGMGFFSILYWLVDHPDRTLTIESFHDGTKLLCVVQEQNGELMFNLKYGDSNVRQSGTRIVLDCGLQPFTKQNVTGFTEQMSRLKFTHTALIAFRTSVNAPFERLNEADINNPDVVYVEVTEYGIRVEDFAQGLSLETLLKKLFVPSVSTKTISVSVQQEGKEEPLDLSLSRIVPAANNLFCILVHSVAVVNLKFDSLSQTKYTVIVHLSGHTRVPVSRDDILLTEQTKLELVESVGKLVSVDCVALKNLAALQLALDTYVKYTTLVENKHFFEQLSKKLQFWLSGYIPVEELYAPLLTQPELDPDGRFITATQTHVERVLAYLEGTKKIRVDSDVFWEKKVVIAPNVPNVVSTAGLPKYLFVDVNFVNENPGDWQSRLAMSMSTDKLYVNEETKGEGHVLIDQLNMEYKEFMETTYMTMVGSPIPENILIMMLQIALKLKSLIDIYGKVETVFRVRLYVKYIKWYTAANNICDLDPIHCIIEDLLAINIVSNNLALNYYYRFYSFLSWFIEQPIVLVYGDEVPLLIMNNNIYFDEYLFRQEEKFSLFQIGEHTSISKPTVQLLLHMFPHLQNMIEQSTYFTLQAYEVSRKFTSWCTFNPLYLVYRSWAVILLFSDHYVNRTLTHIDKSKEKILEKARYITDHNIDRVCYFVWYLLRRFPDMPWLQFVVLTFLVEYLNSKSVDDLNGEKISLLFVLFGKNRPEHTNPYIYEPKEIQDFRYTKNKFLKLLSTLGVINQPETVAAFESFVFGLYQHKFHLLTEFVKEFMLLNIVDLEAFLKGCMLKNRVPKILGKKFVLSFQLFVKFALNISVIPKVRSSYVPGMSWSGDYQFTESKFINFVLKQEVMPGDNLFQQVTLFNDPHPIPLQLTEIAINEGSTKSFVQALLIETIQNSVDAIRQSLANGAQVSSDIKLSLVDTGSAIVFCITDYIGIPMDGIVSLMIPFLSSKTASQFVTGEMGSGFFNLYRESSQVVVRTTLNGQTVIIQDTPIRNEHNRVVELQRAVQQSSTSGKNETNIYVVLNKEQMGMSVVAILTQFIYFITKVIALIPQLQDSQAPPFQLYFQNNLLMIESQLVLETPLFTSKVVKKQTVGSYLFTKGVPFLPLSQFLNTALSLPEYIVPFFETNIIINVQHGVYTPVQTRAKINMSADNKVAMTRFLIDTIYIVTLQQIQSHELVRDVNQVLENFSSGAELLQVLPSRRNNVTLENADSFNRFMMHYKMDGLESLATLIHKAYPIMLDTQYLGLSSFKRLQISQLTSHPLQSAVLTLWLKNKNRKEKFKLPTLKMKPNPSVELSSPPAQIITLEMILKLQIVFQVFVEQYWALGQNQGIVDRAKLCPGVEVRPLRDIDTLGYYNPGDHTIHFNSTMNDGQGMTPEVVTQFLDWFGRVRNHNRLQELDNNILFSAYFKCTLPARIVVHELEHARRGGSHSREAHGELELQLPGQSPKVMLFDQAAVAVYKFLIKKGLWTRVLSNLPPL